MSRSNLESEHQFPHGFNKPKKTLQQPPSMGIDRISHITNVDKISPTFCQSTIISTNTGTGESHTSSMTHGGLDLGQIDGSYNKFPKRKRETLQKNRIEEAMLLQSISQHTSHPFPFLVPPRPHPPPHPHYPVEFTSHSDVSFSRIAQLISASTSISNKGKGASHNSRNKNPYRKRDSSGVARSLLMSHTIMVNADEDVLEKIMAFSHHFSKNIIITSANGTASKARISQFLPSSEAMTHEGRFEILSLNGSMFVTENEYQNHLSAGLKVVLKSLSNGRVFGGRVVDVLIAASPIQIVLWSFRSLKIEKLESGPKELPTEAATNLPSS